MITKKKYKVVDVRESYETYTNARTDIVRSRKHIMLILQKLSATGLVDPKERTRLDLTTDNVAVPSSHGLVATGDHIEVTIEEQYDSYELKYCIKIL